VHPRGRIVEFHHIDPWHAEEARRWPTFDFGVGFITSSMREQAFGAGFMDEKREEARRAAQAKEHARAEAARAKAASEQAAKDEQARALEQSKDMICGLRNLGFRADQARRAAESTAAMTYATLEERIRAALKILCPKRSNVGRSGTVAAAT
jgi:hypothetical protein